MDMAGSICEYNEGKRTQIGHKLEECGCIRMIGYSMYPIFQNRVMKSNDFLESFIEGHSNIKDYPIVFQNKSP